MKILIAYDGSVCSDNAIVDLRRAGLPARSQALILTVAETQVRQAAALSGAVGAGPGMFIPEMMESEESNEEILKEARGLAEQGASRVRADFPDWTIQTEEWIDAAGAAIIRKAHGWRPDLVVVGSHGRSTFMSLVLGSVSSSVLRHAECSVRIGRHRLEPEDRAIRVMIGVDGSECSRRAVNMVASRHWPAGTEARVVAVLDSRINAAAAMTLDGVLPAPVEDEWRQAMSNAAHDAVHTLSEAGLRTVHQILTGRPDEMLVAEAERWEADSIFLGARQLNLMGRMVLGSVSASVASRAHCSVEIVRAPAN